MYIGYNYLSPKQRINAIQRLTALWAFCESGLGGIMHALQIPFTGLIVGGMAIIIITFIAQFSFHNYKQIFQSLFIVLIVKAMISPYTPFPAYIAVVFQAAIGYVVFSLLSINLLSILLLSIIAMLESAIQKILILTLFFGQSFWKATDSLISFITNQLGTASISGSNWVIGIYLLIYFTGGVFIALTTHKIIKDFYININKEPLYNLPVFASDDLLINKKKSISKRLLRLTIVLLIISALLFVFAENTKQGWIAVLKTISWTTSAILIWFMLIGPLFTKFIQWIFYKKKSAYNNEVSKALSFLPVFRQLTIKAWKSSDTYKGWKRWQVFLFILIHWSLIYSDYSNSETAFTNQL